MAEMSEPQTLAELLARAIESRGLTIEAIADRTKVTKSTLAAFLGGTDPALLPSRVYLRGHLLLVVKMLELDPARALVLFDQAFPIAADSAPSELPRMSRASVAFAAGLAGLGVLAIVLSVVTG
jgi:cytoskeletal protein RodZ